MNFYYNFIQTNNIYDNNVEIYGINNIRNVYMYLRLRINEDI